jgi:CheY-like chemotaxis protein
LRVLVVEDDPDNLEMMRVVLAADGHEVDTCLLATEALRLCHEEGRIYDVVLLDVHLPELDGLEALRRLRAHARTKQTPVLCVSATARRSDETQAIDAGANQFLAKPFRRVDLLQAVARTIDPPIRPSAW